MNRLSISPLVLFAWLVSLLPAAGEELPVPSGLELRFDATVFEGLEPGAGIASWPDTSGNDRHAEGGGGAMYGEARTPSGLYTVSFHDVYKEALRFGYNPNDKDITVIAVSRSRHESTEWPYHQQGFISWGEVIGDAPLALGGFNVTQTVVTLNEQGRSDPCNMISVAHDPVMEFTINTVRLDSTLGMMEVYRDGELLGELSGIARPIRKAPVRGCIGGITAYHVGWDGDIAEILLYSRALAHPERQAVEDYLHHKWLFALKAYDPSPPDGAEHVVAPWLSWTAGDTALFHDLYYGTHPELGPEDLVWRGPWGPPYPGPLVPGATYYWRVDEIEADGTVHTGEVWRFTVAPLTACCPEPRDDARFVDPKADLAWAPGVSTYPACDVYFGTSREDVVNGTGETFRGRQYGRTFDPGALAPDTTYYWRIDIDRGGPGGEVYTGEVWSFTTLGPGGGIKGEYFSDPAAGGAPVLTRMDSAIDFDWGRDSPDPAVEAHFFFVRWTGDLEVVFTDVYTFIVRAEGEVALSIGDEQLIGPYWVGPAEVKGRIKLTGGQVYPLCLEYGAGRGRAAVQLFWQSPNQPREIVPAGPLQPPLRARHPYPADGLPHVPHDPTLRWTAGCEATHHDVYFGDDANAVASATTATAGIYRGRQILEATTFTPGSLEWNASYYWRVDEVNDAEPKSPWKGSVWSFTTADFLLIDDFERYTDEMDAGEAIFQTWIDGFGFEVPEPGHPGNGTGSIVGFLEWGEWWRPVVHGGRQSMPFEYNNEDPPYYSEAERTWDVPGDWTVNDVTDLSLWFIGSASNDRADLYVAIEDAEGDVAVVVHPDPEAVLTGQWTEWSIALSDFGNAGVNLAAVKKLYIGVGDRENPQRDGTGRFYVDDVRLIKAEPPAEPDESGGVLVP